MGSSSLVDTFATRLSAQPLICRIFATVCSSRSWLSLCHCLCTNRSARSLEENTRQPRKGLFSGVIPENSKSAFVGRPSRPYLSTVKPQNCVSSLISLLSVVGQEGHPEGYPDPGRLGSCMSYRGRQSEGPEPSRLESSDPMIEADEPSPGVVPGCFPGEEVCSPHRG